MRGSSASLWLAVSILYAGCEGQPTRTDRDGGSTDSGDTGDAGSRRDAGRDAGPPADAGQGADAGPLALDECADMKPGWLFCDAFEGGGTAPFWDGSDTTPTLAQTGGPHGLAGNHVLQLRVGAGSGGSGVWKSIAPQQTLYARYYVRWETGWDLTARHHGPGGLAADPSYNLGRSGIRPDGTDLIQATIESGTTSPFTLYAYAYYPGMYQDCVDPNGSCWGDSFPCSYGPSYCTRPEHAATVTQAGVQPGRWYCLEEQVNAGTPTPSATGADGALDLWLDGVELGPWTPLWLRSTASLKMNTLWLFIYWHEASHPSVGFQLDDVVVSTQRIGCR